jgi:SAM-dependent methyltransferase
MIDLSLQAKVDAATVYEDLFVPALFQEWANRVADAAGVMPGDRVLDVACGTGALARTVAARVSPGGSVVGLDINPGMLSVAARVAPGVAWRQGAAESIPYGDASFNAVVSQFGLMFFSDRQAGLREMVRVLAPRGHLAVAVFDSLDRSPGYAAFAAVLQRVVGSHAANALRFPFALGDRRDLSALLTDAQVPSAEVTTYEGTVRFPSIRAMVTADVRGWFPIAQIVVDDDQFERLVAETERDLRSFIRPSGTVEFPISAHIAASLSSDDGA